MKTLQKNIALLLVISLMLTVNPLKSNAEWRDRSDELPGTVSDGTVLAVAGVGVVLIGGLIFLAIKGKNKQKTSSIILQEQNFTLGQVNKSVTLNGTKNQSANVFQQSNVLNKQEGSISTLPVDLIVKPLSSGNDMAFNTQGMQVGIRIRF